MDSRVQSTVGCFPELCFLQFSVAHVLVGLRMQFINNFVFPAWAGAAGFNNNSKVEHRHRTLQGASNLNDDNEHIEYWYLFLNSTDN